MCYNDSDFEGGLSLSIVEVVFFSGFLELGEFDLSCFFKVFIFIGGEVEMFCDSELFFID